jgi:glucan phosphoethanolaminetransferase (alkaline phosphatase superfamily)
MSFPPSNSKKTRNYQILPWLHLSAGLVVIVFNALFSAVHSPLGQEISAGESPGFAWIRAHISISMGLGLAFLILVFGIQLRQLRQSSFKNNRLLPFLICLEVFCIAAIALLLYFKRTGFLALVYTILMLSILGQAVIAFRRPGVAGFDHQALMLQKPAANGHLFFILLFIFGATISLLEPSRYRFEGQIVLDSNFESLLAYAFPSILSGITNLWLGIGMLGIIIGISRMLFKLHGSKDSWTIYFLIFFSSVALFMGFLLITLYYAISWQINNLHLKSTVWQLYIFLSVLGGILFLSAFYRIVPHIPQPQKASLMGIVSLTFGAAILFPITWLLTLRRNTKACWVILLISVLGTCGFIGYVVLFGNMFNPWFTTFSYLKGAILKIVSVVAAGAAVLLAEQFFSQRTAAPSNFFRLGIALAIAAILGFLPFYALGKYPEVKVAVLQFNELTRVDTTFAREFANLLGLGKWIHLGQLPPQNSSPHPWPQPWILKKSHPSLLPENFNLLVIVVDALRGDAFHSAGYHRNLTPFLDSWASEESISFRRAYSQGGGSFAAFPFLVAGRSRLDLYGPGLYRQNLYFKIAQAEGIQHYMLMKGFGPRNIYPPDFPVTELAIPRAVSDRRSATADEVFQSARNAIAAIPKGERFLCFLQLMDVHNDLWKKKDGVDFGDTPRDLYDNNLSYIDRAFSRFVSWLKQEAIYDRTVVLFTSDHGEQFWEHGASLHGHTVYEEEIRIPLILVSHGIRNRFEDVPVIAADMAPTIADLAGYSVDPPYDDPRMGISLLPLILGKERQRYLKRNVVGRASFKRRYFLYRNWEWKLVYFAELDLLQLFNVLKDPLEKKNWLNERPYLAATMEQDLVEYLGKVEGKTYRGLLSNLLKEN